MNVINDSNASRIALAIGKMLLPSIKPWIKKSMSTLPKVLYKYCDARGIDILLHGRLKVTPFNEFNDPFELAPRMRPDFPERDARFMLADTEYQVMLRQFSVLEGKFTGLA